MSEIPGHLPANETRLRIQPEFVDLAEWWAQVLDRWDLEGGERQISHEERREVQDEAYKMSDEILAQHPEIESRDSVYWARLAYAVASDIRREASNTQPEDVHDE